MNRYKVDEFNIRCCECGRAHVLCDELSRFHCFEQTDKDRFCVCVEIQAHTNFTNYDESEIWREERRYASTANNHVVFTRAFLRSRRVRTRDDATGDAALGMRPRTRTSVHFVTHSCIFRSERFATRASLSRTTSKSAGIFRYTRTVGE